METPQSTSTVVYRIIFWIILSFPSRGTALLQVLQNTTMKVIRSAGVSSVYTLIVRTHKAFTQPWLQTNTREHKLERWVSRTNTALTTTRVAAVQLKHALLRPSSIVDLRTNDRMILLVLFQPMIGQTCFKKSTWR